MILWPTHTLILCRRGKKKEWVMFTAVSLANRTGQYKFKLTRSDVAELLLNRIHARNEEY